MYLLFCPGTARPGVGVPELEQAADNTGNEEDAAGRSGSVSARACAAVTQKSGHSEERASPLRTWTQARPARAVAR